MQVEISTPGRKPLVVTFTDKPVTAYGGLAAFAAFVERLGLRECVREHMPFRLTSPNATAPEDVVVGFMVGVLAGAQRFAHLAIHRHDVALKLLFGLRRFASPTTFARFFRRFTWARTYALFRPLLSWSLSSLPARPDGYTLDLDSTVCERYGEQEGSLKGHNPRKHGRPSHHPLFGFLAEARSIAHAWLRSGNTSSARGASEFLKETLASLPAAVSVSRVRCDSGFFEHAFLLDLERMGLEYVVVGRMNQLVRSTVRALAESAYRQVDDVAGLHVAETTYQGLKWDQPRRMIVVREEVALRPEAGGRMLFELKEYRFRIYITNITQPPLQVWRFYNGRADSENRIRELKDSLGLGGFCSEKFYATEAALLTVCLTYNLIEEFRRRFLGKVHHTLAVLRSMLFVCGAILGRAGRQPVLRLSRTGKWRERFVVLLQRIVSQSNCIAVSDQSAESLPPAGFDIPTTAPSSA